MINILQNALIDKILQPFSKIIDKISEKTKDNIFVISCLSIFLINFYYNSGKYAGRYLYIYAMDCVLFGLMILSSLNKNIKPIKNDKILTYIWFGIGTLMFVSSIFVQIDYLSEAILFLIAYPIAFFVWSNCDYKKIFALLIKSGKYSFIIYLVINFLFYPITERQYQGFFNNVNGTAFYLTCAFCCYYLELIIINKIGKKNIFDLCMFGICSSLMIYTNSRTGELAVLCVFLLTIVLKIIINRNNFKNIVIHNILPLLISALIFLPITMPILQIPKLCSNLISSIQNSNLKNDDEDLDNKSETMSNNKKNTTIFGIGVVMNYNNIKLFEKGDTADAISSGRISIWKDYLKQLNFIGNKLPPIRAISDPDDFSIKNSTAHITILEHAYRYGIIEGLLFLVFNILAGLKSIKFAFDNKGDSYSLVPFAFTIAFGVVSVLSSISSFAYMIGSFYFFVQFPLFKAEN